LDSYNSIKTGGKSFVINSLLRTWLKEQENN
jgi:hypothetical protein